jgi:hypothetical protein
MKFSKKGKSSSGSSAGRNLTKPIAVLIITAFVGFGIYSAWETNPNVRSAIGQYIDNGDIKTLEVRYTPEKIMELYGKELLSEGERSFQKAELKFYPHTLLDVKYSTADKNTKEGILLWSLVDGEMVINCDRWETTHGFQDAINAQANRNDFKILNALEKSKGKLTIDQLQKELHVEEEIFLSWLENAKEKHLVIQKGNEVQLHFQNPRLFVSPQTKMSQCAVSKPYNYAQKVSRRYSPSQIEKTARAAFGQDFTIRSQEAIFLPVYSIEILNPDGSVRTADFNAVTGTPVVLR